jgi:cytochrome P450 family 142 subfamily A polypeptide 1
MGSVSSTSTPSVNLLDPEFYVEPFGAYRWLRDHSPAHWDPVQEVWGISRHADVIAVEKDPRLYSSGRGSRPHAQQGGQSMINMDDPLHLAHRMLVNRRFTPRAIREHETKVREFATEIIDAVVDEGGCEVVEAIASRLPAMGIGHILGFPYELWPLLRRVSEKTMYDAGQTSAEGGQLTYAADSGEVTLEFVALAMPILEQRRADPQDDILSVWAQSEIEGFPFSDAEIYSELLLVIDGGAETTRTVIGSVMRELALQPDQQERLRADPSLLSTTAVEEFIRWVSPISNMRRTATADHEVHGQELRSGDEVVLLYGSANRDERVFNDPDQFDVSRAQNQHVAFGWGTHFCLGAALARLELRVMFEELLHRVPRWRLTGPEPRIVPGTFARGYDAVHVEW